MIGGEAERPSLEQPIHEKVFAKIRVREFLGLYALAMTLAGLGNFLQCFDESVCVFPYVSSWKLHQFVFNYSDLGFAKRALLGSLLDVDRGLSTESLVIRGVALANFLVFSALVLAVSFSLPRALRLLLVASPAVFLQAGYDLGRLDQLNYVLLLLILLSGWSRAILVAPLMVLAHEGAYLIHLPLLFVAHRLIYGRSRTAHVALALSTAVLLGLVLGGDLNPKLDFRRLYPAMDADQIMMLSRSLSENVALVRDTFAHLTGFYFLRMILISVYAGLIFVFLRRMLPRDEALRLPVYLAIFAPLLVSGVGVDWPRWIAAVILNVFILTSVAQAHSADPEPAPAPPARAWRIAAAFALAGPVGAPVALPLLYEIRYALF